MIDVLSLLFIGELMLPSTPHFLWVTEFPLFSCNDEEKVFLTRGRRWSSTHHPFTAPMYEDIPALYAGDYGRVRGQHYDIVLNGVEIGGGSVRIHDPEMQEYVFQNVLQVSTRIQQSSFHLSFCIHPRACMFDPSGPGCVKATRASAYTRSLYTSGHRANALQGF